MDDSIVKKIAQTIAIGAVKKTLLAGGAMMAGHGIAMGFTPADYAAASVAIVAASYSFWNDYGKAIVLSQLEVLKARSLASAKVIHEAGLPSVTVAEIAAQSPTLTEANVTKVAATLAPEVKASVIPAATKAALIVLALLLAVPAAHAQAKFVKPTGNIINDIAAAKGDQVATPSTGSKLGDSGCKATGDPIADLHCVLKAGGAKLILHLKQSYALAAAPASNGGGTVDNTSAMCTKALVPLVQLVVNGPAPGTIVAPDPMALSTDELTLAANPSELDGPIVLIEKLRILRLALQSPALNDACGALVQDEVKNVQSLTGKITSLVTGAGILAPLGL